MSAEKDVSYRIGHDYDDVNSLGERPPTHVPGVRTVNIEPSIKHEGQLKLLKKGNAFTDLAEDLIEKGLYLRAKVHPGGKATIFVATTAIAIGIGIGVAVRRKSKK